MPHVSPLALLDPLLGEAEPAAATADGSVPRLRAVPTQLTAPLHAAIPSVALATPTAAGVYRLPDATPDAGMVGYLVLVPVGTELDVTAVPARQPAPQPYAYPHAQPTEPAAHPLQAAAQPQGRAGTGAGIDLDLERRIARVDGELLELTYLEFELLAHLTANPHRVHTRDHLVSAVWGYGHVGDGRTVDVHVARLRRKLGRHREGIVTVRRVGYKYVPASTR
ncbi:winged helix-turn-helix domain-containing protein [Streptacidiphilus sp. PB12-B1b]|uniref:winged helix-turn-helix domain-containing protein n=1 Tax=Streptacidiphilus sp. PB12-B1b TaxID=2705012 RepID=UPI001CDD6E9A|nr:winged helix-turn-helix domain-containing protein [Streptacidiphilus sp. PB12-B1b]